MADSSSGAAAEVVKLCGACDEQKCKDAFSNKQWAAKAAKRRCKVCVASDASIGGEANASIPSRVETSIECPICTYTYSSPAELTTLHCQHVICAKCFNRMDRDFDGAQRRCPLCRARFLNLGAAAQVHHRDHVRMLNVGLEAALSEVKGHPYLEPLFGSWLQPHGWEPDGLRERGAHGARRGPRGHSIPDIVSRLTAHDKKAIIFMSLSLAMRVPTSYLYLESSPLLRMLRAGADPSALSSPPPGHPPDDAGSTALHWLAELADPNSSASHSSVLVLARQLLDAGADVNTRAGPGLDRITPLMRACCSGVATNLDLIDLYLARGADPNLTDVYGQTAAMHSMIFASAAARRLVLHPSIDLSLRVHSGRNSGQSLIDMVLFGLANISNIGLESDAEDQRHVLQAQLEDLHALISEHLSAPR